MQGTYCFLEGQAKSTYSSLPASTACWCPVHARDPSPLTIWGFTTFTACCTPQLPPLFLPNPASVLHTDECVLHLVLDVSSSRRKLRRHGASYPSHPSVPHSRRALEVLCALVVLTLLTMPDHPFCMCPFHRRYARLLCCSSSPAREHPPLSFGACATAAIMEGPVYHLQNRSGARRSCRAACTAVTSQ